MAFKKLGEAQGYYKHWHWYIDRLADAAIAHDSGLITEYERQEIYTHYEYLWANLIGGE
jgi:hypothetical protein